jgi:hypothetical protein
MITDNKHEYKYTFYMNMTLQANNNKPGKFYKLLSYNEEINRLGNIYCKTYEHT